MNLTEARSDKMFRDTPQQQLIVKKTLVENPNGQETVPPSNI
jgi:hypothetical protein